MDDLQLWLTLSPDAGYSVCIFAYGQTGSGKTHTMAGTDVENYKGRGINYRALDDLFAIRESRKAEVRPPFPRLKPASCHATLHS